MVVKVLFVHPLAKLSFRFLSSSPQGIKKLFIPPLAVLFKNLFSPAEK